MWKSSREVNTYTSHCIRIDSRSLCICRHEFLWCVCACAFFVVVFFLFTQHYVDSISFSLSCWHSFFYSLSLSVSTLHCSFEFLPIVLLLFWFFFSPHCSFSFMSPFPLPHLRFSFLCPLLLCHLPPFFFTSSTPLFCLLEVEPYVGTPRWRPLSFCPCCSPEGNVNSVSPGRISVPTRSRGLFPRLPSLELWSNPPPPSSSLFTPLTLPFPFSPDKDFQQDQASNSISGFITLSVNLITAWFTVCHQKKL